MPSLRTYAHVHCLALALGLVEVVVRRQAADIGVSAGSDHSSVRRSYLRCGSRFENKQVIFDLQYLFCQQSKVFARILSPKIQQKPEFLADYHFEGTSQ